MIEIVNLTRFYYVHQVVNAFVYTRRTWRFASAAQRSRACAEQTYLANNLSGLSIVVIIILAKHSKCHRAPLCINNKWSQKDAIESLTETFFCRFQPWKLIYGSSSYVRGNAFARSGFSFVDAEIFEYFMNDMCRRLLSATGNIAISDASEWCISKLCAARNYADTFTTSVCRITGYASNSIIGYVHKTGILALGGCATPPRCARLRNRHGQRKLFRSWSIDRKRTTMKRETHAVGLEEESTDTSILELKVSAQLSKHSKSFQSHLTNVIFEKNSKSVFIMRFLPIFRSGTNYHGKH